MNNNGEIKSRALQAIQKAGKPGTMMNLKANDVTDIIASYRSAIAQAIPRHLTADRVIQQATTLVSRTPAIAECSVESIIGATMQASILGFQPVATLGQCYFVPFNNKNTGRKEIQFIIGYKGFIDLARRSDQIKSIYAYVVHENDTFEYELGLEPKLKHVPAENPGQPVYAYAVAHFVNGGYAFQVASKQDILKRKKASQSGNSTYSPWAQWEEEMWMKTAVKMLAKWLPLSVEQQKQLAVDEGTIGIKSFADGEINPDLVEIPLETVSDSEYKEETPKKKAKVKNNDAELMTDDERGYIQETAAL